MSADEVVALPAPLSLEDEVKLGQKRTYDMFYSTQRLQQPEFPDLQKIRVYSKVVDEYQRVAVPVPPPAAARFASAASSSSAAPALLTSGGAAPLLLTDASSSSSAAYRPIGAGAGSAPIAAGAGAGSSSSAIVASGALSAVNDVVAALQARSAPKGLAADAASAEQYRKVEEMTARAQEQSRAIVARRAPSKIPTPKWHPPWKLMRVISGHLGWVRSIAVEPGNEWFATGAADRTIKIWDLASGTLKLTLTGHINTVRGIAVSSRHPYMFSAGEDKMVKCWDLETNKVIRHYHGHLSGVYALALHPTLDILFSGGRDSVCRVWDMRTKAQIHVLGGHENSVASILANSVDPQVITGGMDNQVRCWDLAAGKCRTVLTHHKKAIRGMASHPKEFAFVSGAADNLKKWALPNGDFVQNFTGHNSIVNCVAVNQDDVMVSGGDDGSLKFWDWGTGYSFSEVQSKVQPGSLDSEAGIYAMSFDQTGTRLLTCEADKSIKIWREDTDASPESHPVDMKGWADFCRTHKYY